MCILLFRGSALKHLSPNTPDNDIIAAAKNFEMNLYNKSPSKVIKSKQFRRK
jgi:hypothetical protein